jgi:hypothetical protein
MFVLYNKPKITPFTVELMENDLKASISINNPLMHCDKALCLIQHLKLGHAPCRNILWAVTLKILPAKLKDHRNVTCIACQYGKQKCYPWCMNRQGPQQLPIQKADHPRCCICINQLTSGVLSLVAQFTGRLTTS